MRYALLASVFLFALHGPVLSASLAPKTLSCARSADAKYCERKKSDFLASWPKANTGDYMGQRNVAFCLLSGCKGSVEVDFQAACAWSIVIVSTDKSDATDVMNFRQSCGRLDADHRAAAEMVARASYGKIYKSLMTKPLPYEPH